MFKKLLKSITLPVKSVVYIEITEPVDTASISL